jgi:hypothetical protein
MNTSSKIILIAVISIAFIAGIPMVIVEADMDIIVNPIIGMADIQITDMVIMDIGILIETTMAIDCENAIESHF